MIFDLVQDLGAALAAMPSEYPRRRILKLLQEALRRDAHFIERYPTTLFQCTWNSCWWFDCPQNREPWQSWGVVLMVLLSPMRISPSC